MECKICGNSLYENITFENLFKKRYEVHTKCVKKLEFNNEQTYLPFSNKSLIIDSLFKYINPDFNCFYLELKYMSNVYKRLFKNKSWSIVLYLEKKEIINFKEIDYEILFSLSKNNVYIICFDQKLIYHFESNL